MAIFHEQLGLVLKVIFFLSYFNRLEAPVIYKVRPVIAVFAATFVDQGKVRRFGGQCLI